MYIWYITLYEPLPIGGDDVRPMRSALLAEALVKQGSRVELWLPGFEHVHHKFYRNDSVFESYLDNYGIQYLTGCGYSSDTSPKRLIHNRQIASDFSRVSELRTEKPDVLITQIPSLELAESVVAYARKYNIPVILDVRDLWPDNYKRLLPGSIEKLYPLLFFFERRRLEFILENVTAVTAVSEMFLEWSQRCQFQSRSHKVFHIGYKLYDCHEVYVSDVLKEYDIPKGKIYIFFAGTFCSSYNLDVVVLAARKLQEIGVDDVHFIVAGKGEDGGIIERFRREKNISYVGWLSAPNMSSFLRISTIGLAPYASDSLMSLPNKPFEYMAYSMPIISSLKGEMVELIEQHKIGINFDADDVSTLVDAIKYYVRDRRLLEVHSKNSYSVYLSTFDSDVIYKNFSKFILNMVESNGR